MNILAGVGMNCMINFFFFTFGFISFRGFVVVVVVIVVIVVFNTNRDQPQFLLFKDNLFYFCILLPSPIISFHVFFSSFLAVFFFFLLFLFRDVFFIILQTRFFIARFFFLYPKNLGFSPIQ